jgi:hypothetical protein
VQKEEDQHQVMISQELKILLLVKEYNQEKAEVLI